VKVGDLVRLKKCPISMPAIVVSILKGDGYLDVMRSDGVICFAHERSLEVVSESR
jgi:hypothetical protein